MTLPQEIKNYIVEQIDNAEDLRACSLAHRCLTWAAQRKLHRAVRFGWTINNHQNDIADEDTYSNPNIASFVTELSLIRIPPPDVAPLAWEVISRLTNVKVLNLTLCFRDEVWPWVSRANREAILRTFSNVETLRIIACFFCHADALLFLLSAFPKVTTLRVEDVMIFYLEEIDEEDEMRTDHEDFRQAAIKAIPCPHLRRLEMVWYDEEAILIEEAWEPFVEKWIVPLSRIAEPNFSLKWRERWLESEVGGFSKIAKALGPVIRSLDVELSRMDQYEYRDEVGESRVYLDHEFFASDSVLLTADYGVPHCNKLESIRLPYLCLAQYEGPMPLQNCDGWALEVLSRVASPCLQSITLHFAAANVDAFRTFDLPRLNALLIQPHLADATVLLEFHRQILASEAGGRRGWAFFTTISRELPGIWGRRGATIVRLKGAPEWKPPLIHKPWGLP